MNPFMKDNGLIIRLMVMEYIYGRMGENILVVGKITICRVMEFTFIQMEFVTTVSIRMTKKKDSEFTIGQMVGSMMVGGTKASNMELAYM
jgi:hypothetical protein